MDRFHRAFALEPIPIHVDQVGWATAIDLPKIDVENPARSEGDDSPMLQIRHETAVGPATDNPPQLMESTSDTNEQRPLVLSTASHLVAVGMMKDIARLAHDRSSADMDNPH